MPLNKTVNPQKYYSYKDWGQQVYNIANTALDLAGSFKGLSGGTKGGNGSLFNSNSAKTANNSNVNSFNLANNFNTANNNQQLGSNLLATNGFQGGLAGYSNRYGNNGLLARGFAGGDEMYTIGDDSTNYAGIQLNNTQQADQTANNDASSDKASIATNAMSDIGNQWTSGNANLWSNIGSTIQVGNTATVKLIGNRYKDSGQRIAYGDSTYVAPSKRDLDRQTNKYVNDLNNSSFYTNAETMSGLAQDASQDGIYQQVSKDASTGNKILAVGQRSLNASGKGAELGSKIGGFAGPMGSAIGTIAGGVIGGLAGIFGGIGNTRRGRRRLREIQAAQNYANISHAKQIQDSARNIGVKQTNRFWANSIAKGGHIDSVINGPRGNSASSFYVSPSDVYSFSDIQRHGIYKTR